MKAKQPKSVAERTTKPHQTIATRQKPHSRGTTRTAQLISMLGRKNGADVVAISQQFGWQPHTTRAALSRLRKDGHDVIRDRSGKGKPARYRIAQVAPGKAAAHAG